MLGRALSQVNLPPRSNLPIRNRSDGPAGKRLGASGPWNHDETGISAMAAIGSFA